MDAAWGRIQGELTRRGKGLQWLANELGSPIQRVQNWTTRGVPKGAYPEIAAALGKSIDWLAGMEDRPRSSGELSLTDEERDLILALRDKRAERATVHRLPTASPRHVGGLRLGLEKKAKKRGAALAKKKGIHK